MCVFFPLLLSLPLFCNVVQWVCVCVCVDLESDENLVGCEVGLTMIQSQAKKWNDDYDDDEKGEEAENAYGVWSNNWMVEGERCSLYTRKTLMAIDAIVYAQQFYSNAWLSITAWAYHPISLTLSHKCATLSRWFFKNHINKYWTVLWIEKATSGDV